MLNERISRNLCVPYVEIFRNGEVNYLCKNGVLFTDTEYKTLKNLKEEYERREKNGTLYDYTYARNTGFLRKKKKVTPRKKAVSETKEEGMEITHDETEDRKRESKDVQTDNEGAVEDASVGREKNERSVFVICALLAFTSAISMYISTLHTATYLRGYTDMMSAWLMSASVTAYNATAFEVSVLFHNKNRKMMAFIFMLLWVLVTLFSMATTVSVFYDQFNFQEVENVTANRQGDSARLTLSLLKKEEQNLSEAIDFKMKDMEYRQAREYSTTAVRSELNKLQDELQENYRQQKAILESNPEATEQKSVKKEGLFAFLGRMLHLEGGVLEFTMSTLSAVFVNLIAPLSLTAVLELRKRVDCEE